MTENGDVEAIDPATGIDWDQDFVWVQSSGWLKRVDEASAPAGSVTVKGHDGSSFEITQAELDQDFMALDPGRLWKPRYRPVKAHILKSAAHLAAGEELPKGSAILRHTDGSLEIVPSALFLIGYQVIGFAGTRFPMMPFQTTETAA